MTTLLMIRHGQSQANLEKYFAGHTNAPLTELGRAQAEASAQYIADNYSVAAVYASDLQRAYHTGLAAANRLGLPITADPQLRELYAGEWEGVPFAQIDRKYPEDIALFRNNIGLSRCTGGESVMELAQRIKSALDRIAGAHDGQTLVIATHATPIRCMLWLATGTPAEEMQQIPWPTNASVTEFSWDAGRLTVAKPCADSHLADLNTTFSINA